MEYFPITVQMKNRLCLIVGGGEIAARKLKHLLKAHSRVVMVSCYFTDEIQQLAQLNKITLITQAFSENIFDVPILQDLYLIIAATDDEKVNLQVSEIAQKKYIWVNVVDNLNLSTFIMPAVIDRSPLLIAVSTSGVSPVLARIIREKIEWLLPKSLGLLLNKLKALRPELKKKFTSIKEKRAFSEWFIEAALEEESLLSKHSEISRHSEVSKPTALNSNDSVADSSNSGLSNPLISIDDYQALQKRTQRGTVYLVGAGPGDADLLTVKALKLLQKADVVLYDALVSNDILECIRKDAHSVCVGKRAGNHSVKQQRTNQLLVDYAKQGLSVVRLKGGDPFIFGRGGEELEFLLSHSIEFEVVPGITAASGCASYAGIPLTHRDHSQSVRFVTGHQQNANNPLDWQALANENQTLVFYMGLTANKKISDSLIGHGLSADTPTAIIQQGTTRQQRVVITQLDNLLDSIDLYDIKPPALIIIGTVVQLSSKLNWFKQGELILSEIPIKKYFRPAIVQSVGQLAN